MSAKRTYLLAASAVVTLGSTGSLATAAEPLQVIATFSILGDMVARVGGEHVEVTTLVGPNGDGHVYAPTPADARKTAAADLVVANGLGFEGWIDRLVEASGYAGPIATVSAGAATISVGETQTAEHSGADHHSEAEGAHDHAVADQAGAAAGHGGDDHAGHAPGEKASEHRDEAGHHHAEGEKEAGHHHAEGDIDPHAWQALDNAVVYVNNIAEALCGIDTTRCDTFRANAATYATELTGLDAKIKAQFAAIPEERRKVITSHDAFGYFGKAYGIQFLSPQGVSTESEASAADVASLIDQIREENVTALFVENVSDPRLIEQIGRETGVHPGGSLFSDALSELGGPAPTYLQMMEHNASVLAAAMQGS
jgi:zinc/manganese transport system substrate-binding protein